MIPTRNRTILRRVTAIFLGSLLGLLTSLPDFVIEEDQRSENKFNPFLNREHKGDDLFADYYYNLYHNRSKKGSQSALTPISILEPRLNKSEIINPYPHTVLLSPPNLCKEDPLVVVFVHSGLTKHGRRDIIRKTWGNSTYHGSRLKMFFVIASDQDPIKQKSIRLEHQLYRDILQESFLDTYKNLSLKAVGALGWILSNCPNTSFIVKTDDDAFVNTFSLLAHLSDLQRTDQTNNLLMCRINQHMPVMRTGRWAVSFEEYPEKRFPPYCAGVAYIMTRDTALALYEASYKTRQLWVDDAWFTGLVAKQAKISLLDIKELYSLDKQLAQKKFLGDQWYQYLFAHLGPKALVEFWTELVEKSKHYQFEEQWNVVPGVVVGDGV